MMINLLKNYLYSETNRIKIMYTLSCNKIRPSSSPITKFDFQINNNKQNWTINFQKVQNLYTTNMTNIINWFHEQIEKSNLIV